MVYKVTKNGKPQGREYPSPEMANAMARALRRVCLGPKFDVIAMESDLVVLDELVAMDCNGYGAPDHQRSLDRMHRL